MSQFPRVSTASRPTSEQIARRLNVLNEALYDRDTSSHPEVQQNASEIILALLRWFEIQQISIVLDSRAQCYTLSAGGQYGR